MSLAKEDQRFLVVNIGLFHEADVDRVRACLVHLCHGAVDMSHGAGNAHNESAHTGCVFGGKLYFGTAMIHMTNIIQRTGADIIRIDENDQWQVVVGHDSLSG